MKLKLSVNSNGQKVLKIARPGFRGFSIQTNGNLPLTHKMSNADLGVFSCLVYDEAVEYVKKHGTPRQLEVLTT